MRPRLAQPETRSRLAGYLGTAAVAGAGWRTDGQWVWPDHLADHVRVAGVGPQRELVDHIAARYYLLPAEVSEDALAEAARLVHVVQARPVPAPAPAGGERFLVGRRGGDPEPVCLVRLRRTAPGAVDEDALGPCGWRPVRATCARSGLVYTEAGDRAAAGAADRLCAGWHERLLAQARESVGPPCGPRVARVFDGASPAGRPWFSPGRLRIIEPERRRRLSAYLSGGRLVLRASGRMLDQLDPGKGRVVPLHYRTDGVWVWPEALDYYLSERGVAPELEFLCHIEERGMRLPEALAGDVLAAAAAAARVGPGQRAASTPVTYYLDDESGQTLVRAPAGDRVHAQALQADLRWRTSESPRRGRFHEIDEAAALRLIDERWARLSAVHGEHG